MTDRLSFDELCSLTETPRRTVRYYIQRGLVDRPLGETRGAYYTTRHVEQLLTVRKWSNAGVSLERITELLSEGGEETLPAPRRKPGDVAVWSHLYVADGVEMQIEPGLAGMTPEQVRAFARGVMALYEDVRSGATGAATTRKIKGDEK